MDFLERLKQKAYVIDLSSLPKEDKEELIKHFEELKRNPPAWKMSPETQKEIEDAINNYETNR